ncbi:hypothetical protein M422DRAFT_165228, partial [Sphaerobolus stellatus SS14]
RKQKMRCEGAENPPCRRCRHAGLECLFEKPSREPTLTGEAGLERIRSLEAQVSDIRTTQHTIHATLLDLVAQLRAGPLQHSSQPLPSPHQPYRPSPASPYNNTQSPASASTVTPGAGSSQLNGPGTSGGTTHVIDPSLTRGGGALRPSHIPFRHLHLIGSYPYHRPAPVRRNTKNNNGKRVSGSASNSSDEEDVGGAGELPASGLVAPWEVLRGLADAAAERAAKESNTSGSEPASRARTHSPPPSQGQSQIHYATHANSKHGGEENGGPKPAKRRKTHHRHGLGQGQAHGRQMAFPDVVTRKIIGEQEARDLFDIFYRGCSTFLPVFDSKTDTFDGLHDRSPFAVDCICLIAARVKGGSAPSELYNKCFEEVKSICCATLFSPVQRQEAVQAMILVSGWSDNGWLTAGHAVRMALELGMSRAWPKLLKKIRARRVNTSQEERELVISVRTWFVLYLFEHQMSYGNGQPAILRYDESIANCRELLEHPLAIEDDMRLVSMLELIVIREHVHNKLTELDRLMNEGEDVEDQIYEVLRTADNDFARWYAEWDERFGQRYPDAVFYRQSLQVQQYFAELFHNATALRGINRPEDVATMPEAQRAIAIRSIQIAKKGLETSLQASAYRENLKYAVHYTHATATFAASFLIRLARLIPEECDLKAIKKDVEELANVLEQTPSQRYARSLRYMLRKASERNVLPEDKSAGPMVRHKMDVVTPPIPHANPPNISPTSSSNPSRSPTALFHPQHPQHMVPPHQQHPGGMQPPSHVYGPPPPGMGYPPPSHHPQYQHQQHQQHQQHYQQHPQAQQQQWYPEQQMYGEPDMHVWANMDLNAGAVMNGGMEAYIIPAGYVEVSFGY